MEIKFNIWFVIYVFIRIINLVNIYFPIEDKKGQEEIPAFDGYTIELYPMQIRSFIIKLKKS
jgi:hypothetical protein